MAKHQSCPGVDQALDEFGRHEFGRHAFAGRADEVDSVTNDGEFAPRHRSDSLFDIEAPDQADGMWFIGMHYV